MRRLAPLPALLVSAALIAAACSSSGSLDEAGDTTQAVVTIPELETTTPDGSTPDTTTPPATEPPATTLPDPLDELPECPVEALDEASGTVNITFWHGMTADLETALRAVTDTYNASQTRVRVTLQNQGGYEEALEQFLLSGQGSRPEMLQAPEYAVQVLRDTDAFIPVEACMEAEGFDTSTLLPAALNAYTTGGVRWAMPFNMSNPVLYYNKQAFRDAGLDPEMPPASLEELRAASQTIVDSGAAAYGIALDTDFDSGGGWFIEQWFAKAGEFYSDNENGRSAPSTRVLFDNQTAIDLYTFLQSLVADGLAINVGDNPSGQDNFLRVADATQPAAMTIGTSAALGAVLTAVPVLAPQIGNENIGVAPMPGPEGNPAVLVGGASLWIVNEKGSPQAAAVWDFIKYLLSAETQSAWAAATGYVPVNEAAVDVDPLRTTYTDDPRFKVAYDSVLATPDVPTAVGPLLGPHPEVRLLTARALAAVFGGADPATELAAAASRANALIAEYNQRVGN